MTKKEAIAKMEKALEAAAAAYNAGWGAESAGCAAQACRLFDAASTAAAIAGRWGELAALLPDEAPGND